MRDMMKDMPRDKMEMMSEMMKGMSQHMMDMSKCMKKGMVSEMDMKSMQDKMMQMKKKMSELEMKKESNCRLALMTCSGARPAQVRRSNNGRSTGR